MEETLTPATEELEFSISLDYDSARSYLASLKYLREGCQRRTPFMGS